MHTTGHTCKLRWTRQIRNERYRLDSRRRVAAAETLRRYDILDTPPDVRFDNITTLAAELVQAPVALISLVDADRIWFKSVHGLDVRELPRDDGLCSTAIEQDAPYVVEDTFASPRARNHPLVTADPAIRFYAGVPLKADDGRMLGVLGVMDFKPRTLPAAVLRQLQSLALLTVDQLDAGAYPRPRGCAGPG
jgi:GAF domain-containing protein